MGNRSILTNAVGDSRFPALPTGESSVKAEQPGFSAVVQENVRLTTTTRLTIDITLKPTAVEEQVTVIAQSPTVDIKSTETASVTFTNELLRNIPYSQFTADIANLAPGVNADVAYGAGDGRGINYQMDGVGVADPVGGTAWVFLDHNIIEEAKIMGIGLPAEYGNFTGVIFNLITKSGGNELSGHFETVFQGNKAREPGLESSWPGSGFWGTENNDAYVEDFPEVTSPLEKLLDANAHLGGPIVRDKLWFFAGAQYYNSQDWVTGFPYAQDYKSPRFFLKLTSQLAAKTNLIFSGEYDDYDGTYRGASANVHPDATVDQIDPEYVLNLSLTHIISSKTFVDFKAAYFDGYYNLEPRMGRDVNSHYFINDNPDIPGDQTHMRYYNAYYWDEHPRSRFQANASLTHYAENFLQGDHDFKFGVELERARARDTSSYTGANHFYYQDYWGYGYYGNYSAYQYEGYNLPTNIQRLEGFVQDSWQITDRLNLNLGLRASRMWGKIRDASETQYSAFRLAPRIGLTYDILGDKTTVLKAHYGEFTDGMFTAILDRLSPEISDWVLWYWDPEGQEWYESYRVPHGTWTMDDDMKHPFMRQFTVGLERELFKDTSFSATYINRSFHNFVGAYNALATYEPVAYTVNEIGKTFTLYNLTSGDAAEWHITNMESMKDLYKDSLGLSFNPYRNYWGLEFLLNKRFSNKWQLMASYVYSQTTGTMQNSTYEDLGWGRDVSDPNTWVNADGHMENDPTHMIKIQGTYILPFEIAFNFYFRGITGYSWQQRYRSGSRDFDQGRVTFNAEAAGSRHYPMATSLDLRLEKIFSIATKYKLGLIVDIFNVFNDDSITSWGTRIGYDWLLADDPEYTPSTEGHDLYGLVLPRRTRVGIRLMF